jgi:Ca2+-binding EF-hand superfamily protein
MPGLVKQASIAIMIAIMFAPSNSTAQSSTQGLTETPAKKGSVLDRIRKKIKEANTPKDRARRWFDNLDLNKDKEITKQELFETIRRRFETLDRTGDKFVSKSEYLGPRKDRASGEARFGALDSNGDGRLSMSEFASPADWRFDRIDRNLDGKVSESEAARLFDRPVGKALPDEDGECFYVDRQVVRVKEEVAKTFKKRGYPKADCGWIPEATDELKPKKYIN